MFAAEERKAFLYCAAPPISEDDLKVIADTTLSRGRMLSDSAAADRVIDTMARVLDPNRFDWVLQDRVPTTIEMESAVQATSALVAAQQVQTFRRNEGKNRQEQAVKDVLLIQGFKEVRTREITGLASLPNPGEFMGETIVVGHQADVVAVLPDKRILCIECKVSNSMVNSRKRLVHDTGGKAPGWYQKLGTANAVVIGVLTGVFTVDLCEIVQNQRDVYLFWEHRLDDLANFVGTIP